MDKLRVLHTPMNTGGHPIGLAAVENNANFSSSVITLSKNKFGYHSNDEIWGDTRNRLYMEIKRISLIKQAISNFDIIHYNSGTTIAAPILPPDKSIPSKHNFTVQWVYSKYLTFLQQIELAMLKKANKGIFVTFQGSDARQGDYCEKNYEIHNNNPGNTYYSQNSDTAKRERINLLDHYADRLYALNPDLMNVLPQRTQFVPYASVDLEKWKPPSNSPKKRLRIIHAPSNRQMKGSDHLLRAVERLRSESFEFDFELIENLTREKARLCYDKADILVDQLLIGWYGGLSVELMALGKPVICYIRQDDLKHIPKQMQKDLSIINATPDTIYDVLKNCILNVRDEYEKRSNSARKYVETWHNPDQISKSISKDYLTVMESKRNSGISDRNDNS